MAKRINPAFGQKIRTAREARGSTQQALAEKSGVPIGTLREIEQGRREPLFGVVQRLASALEVPATDFPATTDRDEGGSPVEVVEVGEPAKRGRPKKAEAPPAEATKATRKPRAMEESRRAFRERTWGVDVRENEKE